MLDDALQLTIQVDAGPDADDAELDEATARLRQQLLELDVQSVERQRAGDAPPGTRGPDMLVLGGLVVGLTRSPEMLKMVSGLLQGWVSSRQGRSVELKIGDDALKVTGISPAEQRQLIDMFVARHTT